MENYSRILPLQKTRNSKNQERNEHHNVKEFKSGDQISKYQFKNKSVAQKGT